MDKKAITLQQLEEALRDLTGWLRDKLSTYLAEPAAEGKSGYVLTTNGAGGRSWEPGGAVRPDDSLSQTGIPADAAAVGTAVEELHSAAEAAQNAAEAAQAAADAVSVESIGAEKKRLQFTAVPVVTESFEEDGTYEDFPLRAAVALEGVTADMVPEITFSVGNAMSGNYAPVAESYDGGIYIYAAEKPSVAIAIPTIVVWR